MMRTARVSIAALCMLMFLMPSAAYAAPKYRTRSVALDSSHKVTVSSSKGSVVLLGTASRPRKLGMSEREYRFVIGSKKKRRATVYLTVRSLPTTSQVVFARLESPKQAVPVTVTFVGRGSSFSKTALGLKPNLTWNKHTGVDRTSGPYGWVNLTSNGTLDRSVFLSKAYRYRRLTHKYRKGSSTVKALVSENSLVSVRKLRGGTISVSMGLSASKDSCERYFIISPRAIVDTSTPTSLVAAVTAAEWRWVDPRGSYRKASYTEPYNARAYCTHLGLMRGRDTNHNYAIGGSALFENLILSNLYTLALTRSADGLWRTNHTSMWVKKESGIVAPYVDTRHNEAFALQSPRVADALAAHGVTAADGIREWAPSFARFLLARAAAGNVMRTANGYYFSDYYDATGRPKVHSSLNHSLGEMCYLLHQSGDGSATAEFGVAMNIRAAIDDCGSAWIAPGHNTYYQRNVNGKYEGYESAALSVPELKMGQAYFLSLLGATDPVFDSLIANKEAQLGITASGPDRSKGFLPAGEDPATPLDSPAELP